MKLILIAVIVLMIGFALWVRIVPARPANWHRVPQVPNPGDTTTIGSHAHRRAASPADLARLDQIIRATARTRVMTGSVAEGMVTYETRSLLWGFPDYTTVHLDGPDMVIYGRLRFGRGDLGVNKARITRWLATLDADASTRD